MKITVPVIALILLHAAMPLHAITFEESATWPEVLKMARAQNKIIFVDAYATWCGPCKMMDRNVFPDEALSAFFDENFINVKIDMESERGTPFGADYEVDAYPSLFFIGPDGSLLKKKVGLTEAPELLSLGQFIVDPAASPVGQLQIRFDAGERDTALLKSLAMESIKLGTPHQEATRLLLLATDPALVAAEVDYFVMLYNAEFLPGSELGVYFSDHFDLLLATYDRYMYEKLSNVIIAHLSEGLEKDDIAPYFESAREYITKTVQDEEIRTALLEGVEEVRKSLKE
jgi:thiol-disulfide isomerase/thioredoxin